jgi:hypothetical protein
MSDGFVVHYTTPLSGAEIAASLESYDAAGLTVENGLTHVVSLLDGEGDQVNVDRKALIRVLFATAIGERTTFQLWLSESVDVVCSYERLAEDLAAHRYSLDGLLANEIEMTVAAVTAQIGRPSPKTVALAVDREGVAAEVDLDAIVRERGTQPPAFPGDVFLARWG